MFNKLHFKVSVKDEVSSQLVFTSEVEHALQEGQRKPHSRPSLPPSMWSIFSEHSASIANSINVVADKNPKA